MKHLRLLTTTLGILIGLVVLGGASWALVRAHQHGHGGPHHSNPVEFLTKTLNLTDQQATQIKTIFETEHQKNEAIFKQLMQLHHQIMQDTADGKFDEAQVRALANQSVPAWIEGTVSHERIHTQVYAILTPEQRQKADTLHHQFEGFGDGPPPLPLDKGPLAEHLNLSDQQKAQIQSILQNDRTANEPLVQQLTQFYQQIHTANANGFNETQVRAIATKAAPTAVELFVSKARTQAQLFNVLTPEQKELLKNLHTMHGPGHGKPGQ